MLMSGRVIPAILGEGRRLPGFGPLPTPWSSTNALQLWWPLWVSFHLLTEDKGLVLSAFLIPFHSNRFVLCPWATSCFQKLCPAPFPPVNRYMCVWAYYICDFCIALRKCRSSCEKTTGVDCDILSSSCPSVWFKSFSNENKAELEVIAHRPCALVSRPPLVIWKMQKHPFVLLRLIITDILNLQFWNKLSLMHLNSLILFYLRVKMFMDNLFH